MHAVLDGTEGARRDLDAHLEGCASCAREFRALRVAAEAVRLAVDRAPDEASLNRVAAGVERALLAEPLAARRPAGLRWAGGIACLAVVFALGALAGRSAWPRTVEVTRLVERPTVVEKVVEVEVPVEVVRERVVERRVPVTRIVYRDRAAAGAPTAEEPSPEPREAAVRVVTGGGENGQLPWTATIGPRTSVPVVSYEVRPATIARNADASGADEAGEDTIGAEASASTTQACAYTGAEKHGRDER